MTRPINNDRNNQTVTRAAFGARRFNRQTIPPQIKTVTPSAMERVTASPVVSSGVNTRNIPAPAITQINQNITRTISTAAPAVIPSRIQTITGPQAPQSARNIQASGAAPALPSYGINNPIKPDISPVPLTISRVEGLDKHLKGLTADITVTENVVPGKIETVTPPAIWQMERNTPAPAIPAYNRVNLNNQTISAAATAPTPPMTTAEQYYYTEKTSREQVDIGIRTEPGTTATIARQPRSPNVRVLNAGGNNAR
jgi:hypothetical protein